MTPAPPRGGAGVITYCEIPLKIEFIVVSSRSCNFGEEQHFCMVSKAADRYHSPLPETTIKSISREIS